MRVNDATVFLDAIKFLASLLARINLVPIDVVIVVTCPVKFDVLVYLLKSSLHFVGHTDLAPIFGGI